MPLLDEEDQEYAKRKLFFLTNIKNKLSEEDIEANQFRTKAKFYKSNPNININFNELEFAKSNSNLTKIKPNFNYLSNYEIEDSLDFDKKAIIPSQEDYEDQEHDRNSDFLMKSKKNPNFIKKHIFKQNSVQDPSHTSDNTMYPLNRFNSFANLNQSQANYQNPQLANNKNNSLKNFCHETFEIHNKINYKNDWLTSTDKGWNDYQRHLNKTSEVWHKSKFFAQKSICGKIYFFYFHFKKINFINSSDPKHNHSVFRLPLIRSRPKIFKEPT
jgi:hypothetical protein